MNEIELQIRRAYSIGDMESVRRLQEQMNNEQEIVSQPLDEQEIVSQPLEEPEVVSQPMEEPEVVNNQSDLPVQTEEDPGWAAEGQKFAGVFTALTPEEMSQVEKIAPRFNKDITYTPSTVLADEEAMNIMRKYMYSFEGITPDVKDEELVDLYLSKMRKFASGQSVVTISEALQLQKAEDSKLAKAGEAYDLYDKFEGIFSDEFTWGETFDGLGTYARSIIWDPTNLIGLGIGGLAAKVGSRGASIALKSIATKASANAIKRATAKGATSQAAELAGKQAAQKAVERASRSAAITTGLKKEAFKQAGAATAVDATLALGVDYAYQYGLIKTGKQEDYSAFQGGLTALGALGAGMLSIGIDVAGATRKAVSGYERTATQALYGVDVAKEVAKKSASEMDGDQFASNMQKFFDSFGAGDFPEFSERVAKGKLIAESGDLPRTPDDTLFFKYFLLGNDDIGVKGLAESLFESGVRVAGPRYQGDNITSFISDVLSQLPEETKNKFVDSFRETVGVMIPDYKNYGVDDIANLLSQKTSEGGQVLNIQSQVASILRSKNIDPNTGTLKSALSEMYSEVPETIITGSKTRNLSYYQNLTVQTIVANPSTTALNIKGGLGRAALDSSADLVRGALYTTAGMTGLLTGDWKTLTKGVHIMRVVGKRAVNLVTPNATKEQAMSYIAMRPEVEDTLFRYLSGGVDNKTLADQFNIDLGARPDVRAMEGYKNFAQKLYLVQAQDRFFKTQNFMYYLDKNIREEYGETYQSFLDNPELAAEMASEKFLALELKSVDETNKSVFAKSFSSRDPTKNPIDFLATGIEQIRKVPIVGLAAPFGQFFNNTIDFMSDYTGAKLLYRTLGGGEGRSAESLTESASRAAIGWTGAWYLSLGEEEYIKQDLAWDQERDDDGQIVTKVYDYPESLFKMGGRLMAHVRLGNGIPDELWVQFVDTFGIKAFARSLETGAKDVGDLGAGIVYAATNMDKLQFEDFAGAFSSIASPWVSGLTRPIDPINQMVGAMRPDGQVVIDRKQGVEGINNSLRYVDQIFIAITDSISGEGAGMRALGTEEKASAVGNSDIQTLGKVLGYRTVPEQTYTQKMFNSIERPDWKTGIYTKIPEANNRVNEIIKPILEYRARNLLTSKRYDDLSMREKKFVVNRVLGNARTAAMEVMELSLVVGDQQLAALFKLYKRNSTDKIDEGLERLGLSDIPYQDLNTVQLDLLTNVVNNMDKDVLDLFGLPLEN